MIAGRRPASMVVSKGVGSDYSTVVHINMQRRVTSIRKNSEVTQRPIKMQDRQVLQPISY